MELFDIELFDEDSKGIRLLKKGQKGLAYALFSRFGIVVALLLLQVVVLLGVFRWFAELQVHYAWASALFMIVMVVYMLNSNLNSTAKITWMILFMVLPVFGGLLFWYIKSDLGYRTVRYRMNYLIEETKNIIPQKTGGREESGSGKSRKCGTCLLSETFRLSSGL